MEEFAVQKENLRDQRAAALSDLIDLRHGAPCYFDGEDVTSALVARAEEKIRALDKLIAEQEAEAQRCMGPAPPAKWTYAAHGWVGLSC